MAESRDATEVHWVDPRRRGILPLDGFHLSRSLARHIRRTRPRVTVDTAFAQVVAACADRERNLDQSGHRCGLRSPARAGPCPFAGGLGRGPLVGGVYGVVIGAAFFGESMFSRATGGSKTALAYLVHRLLAGGFRLFDTQFLTPHLASLGAVEIPRAEYHRRLATAIAAPATFDPAGYQPELSGTSQCSTQTS